MKIFSILALILALLAIAVSAYGRFQVYPDFIDASQGASQADGASLDVVEDLRSTLNLLAYPSLGMAALAIVFGGMSFIWGRHPIGIVAAVLGTGAVILALLSRPTVVEVKSKNKHHFTMQLIDALDRPSVV